MDCYKAIDITASTKVLCKENPLPKTSATEFHQPDSYRIMSTPDFQTKTSRNPHASHADRGLKVKTHDRYTFSIGKETVDLRYVEQLADFEQTSALASMPRFACESLIDNQLTLDEVAKKLISILETKGFSGINSTSYLSCGLAMPRKQEIYACLNRFRRK